MDQEKCQRCDETGKVECSRCHGTGKTIRTVYFYTYYGTCITCDGGGKHKCYECDGKGFIDGEKLAAAREEREERKRAEASGKYARGCISWYHTFPLTLATLTEFCYDPGACKIHKKMLCSKIDASGCPDYFPREERIKS